MGLRLGVRNIRGRWGWLGNIPKGKHSPFSNLKLGRAKTFLFLQLGLFLGFQGGTFRPSQRFNQASQNIFAFRVITNRFRFSQMEFFGREGNRYGFVASVCNCVTDWWGTLMVCSSCLYVWLCVRNHVGSGALLFGHCSVILG